jgi:rhodanese-related sulfurtransferase
MIKKLISVTLIGASLAMACQTSHKQAGSTEQAAKSIQQVTVAEVSSFVKNKSAVIVDANGADTRKEYGVIPGALLLTSHKDYPLTELPPDKAKKLVFYCGGVMCRASDAAAERASLAGYRDVSVLREGIKGWKGAGQPTDNLRS